MLSDPAALLLFAYVQKVWKYSTATVDLAQSFCNRHVTYYILYKDTGKLNLSNEILCLFARAHGVPTFWATVLHFWPNLLLK
jgi:hypothetical protein